MDKKHTYFISKLDIGESGVELREKSEEDKDFFIQQGSLDGACAVYSFFMLLMIQGIIERGEIGIYMKVRRNTFVGKLVHHFFADNGMHWEGNYFSDLKEGFEQASTRKGHVTVERANNRCIVEYLEQDIPVMLSVQFKGKDAGAHAVVAIGYEEDEEGNLTKLFCLDPGGDKPQYAYHNNIILINEYPTAMYKEFDVLSESQVCLDEILVVE